MSLTVLAEKKQVRHLREKEMIPDNSEIAKIEYRLKGCIKRLHELAPMLGQAKQVRDYDSDRRKNLLAKYVVKHLKLGESATAADQYARAEDAYVAQLDVLSQQREAAEKTIAENDAEYASFEACRSLMSMAKESIKTFQG